MICSPHSRSPWRTWQSWYDVIIWQSDWLFPSNGIQGRTSASWRHLLFKVVTFPALGTMNIRLYWSLWTQVNSGPSIQPFDNRCPLLEQSMTIMVYAVIFEYKQRRYVYCCEYWQNHTTFKHSYFYVRAFSNWKVFRLTQTKLFFWAHNFVKKAAWQAGGTLETCLNGISIYNRKVLSVCHEKWSLPPGSFLWPPELPITTLSNSRLVLMVPNWFFMVPCRFL